MLVLFFGKYVAFNNPDKEIPSILGFKSIHDGIGTHLDYKMLYSSGNIVIPDDEAKTYVADYPFFILAGNQFISVYPDFIEHHYVGDASASLIRVIDSKQRLKNGSLCSIERKN